MALVAFLYSFVRLSELMGYYSLYTLGTLVYLSIGFTLYMYRYSFVASLPERCNGVGLISDIRLFGCSMSSRGI